ncbi:MAG: hypothetical protein V4630_02945, partial [Pseudomonadota bacterium]
TTLFDRTRVLRPMSRLSAFRYYRFERGVLHRNPQEALDMDLDRLRLDAIDALSSGIQALERVPIVHASQSEIAGMGHNNPPEEFHLKGEEVRTANLHFSEAKEALHLQEREPSKYLRAIETATALAKEATLWLGEKIDTSISEFSKEFGKTLGGKVALSLAALHFTGALERIVQTLSRFIESIM